MSEKDGFLQRWSRRKRDPRARREEEIARATHPEAQPGCVVEEQAFAGFDFDSLDFTSDYRRFMTGAVSDQVRNKALQRLWTSTDIIAQPDELDDYLEDFREEAMGLPAAMARSAYRIGRGFINSVEQGSSDDRPQEQKALSIETRETEKFGNENLENSETDNSLGQNKTFEPEISKKSPARNGD
jgi:Protein of unknown function (DUF3306)